MTANQVTLDMDELRSLVREMVLEILAELAADTDSDAGLEFKPEIADYLRSYMKDRPDGIPIEDVIRELGLDV
jgi:hypothetical protein